MNTGRKAVTNQILEFLRSDKKICLLTGTHQFEKHKIVLKTIVNNINAPSKILFRANVMQNLGSIFNNHQFNFKTGVAYNTGKHKLYVDTINSTTWKNSPSYLNYAILYPYDSIAKNSNKEKILDDLCIYRNVDKIFIVSWTDHKDYDYSWLKDKYSIENHSIFDAEEEDLDYHKRVLEFLSE